MKCVFYKMKFKENGVVFYIKMSVSYELCIIYFYNPIKFPEKNEKKLYYC